MSTFGGRSICWSSSPAKEAVGKRDMGASMSIPQHCAFLAPPPQTPANGYLLGQKGSENHSRCQEVTGPRPKELFGNLPTPSATRHPPRRPPQIPFSRQKRAMQWKESAWVCVCVLMFRAGLCPCSLG